MTLLTILIQIILTIPLTILLNYYQKEQQRKINQILIPTIYTIIVSALIPSVKENVFLIVIFEIFIRNFYITNIVNKPANSKPLTSIIENIISVGLSIFTYNYFISKVDSVIPNPEEIKGFIWFLIMLYVVYLYSLKTKNNKELEQKENIKLKSEQIIMQYAKLKNKYSSIVKAKNQLINNTIYSIMIFEEFRTPRIYRNINSTLSTILRKETKHGIMQIASVDRISDEESISITLTDFEKSLKNTKLKESEKLDKLLTKYTNEEKESIKNIYKEIVEFCKK